jgi:hypothetical protein
MLMAGPVRTPDPRDETSSGQPRRTANLTFQPPGRRITGVRHNSQLPDAAT